jgi:hypothetical protein
MRSVSGTSLAQQTRLRLTNYPAESLWHWIFIHNIVVVAWRFVVLSVVCEQKSEDPRLDYISGHRIVGVEPAVARLYLQILDEIETWNIHDISSYIIIDIISSSRSVELLFL